MAKINPLSTQGYKGTRDFYPEEMRLRRWMFGKLRAVVENYGFEEYDGPLLESFDLYAAKSGEEIVHSQLYSFVDRGERKVAIRPEMTPTLARMVAAKLNDLPRPIRWYSIPNLWRYERPQRGRLREHWQLNVDILGGEPLWADVELLQIAGDVIDAFDGGSHLEIKVNNRKLMDFIFTESLKLTPEVTRQAVRAIDARPKIGDKSYFELLAKSGVSAEQTEVLEKLFTSDLKSINQKYKCAGSDELSKLFSLLADHSIFDRVRFDPSVMRGLDYYTGTVFEIFDTSPENNRAMFGGGRYDNLVGLFGKESLSGVGFGMGDVTLWNFLETHKLFPNQSTSVDLYLAILDEAHLGYATKIADGLRKQNVKVMTSLQTGKVGSLIKAADKHHAQWVGLVGGDEAASRKLTIKHLATSKQETVEISPFENLARRLKTPPGKVEHV